MKKILVTGSNGLLGQKLIEKLVKDPNFEILGISKGRNRLISIPFPYHGIDIIHENEVKIVFKDFKPDIVIHTAAMTNVDACETQKKECEQLNIEATRYLIEASKMSEAHFIHLSTDFIFDGISGPYIEEDKANPLSFYGWSKFESEKIVKNYPFKWSIVRTVLVYGIVEGLSRTNIVLWAKSALEKGEIIKVVDDQFRTPTLAEDLADGCLAIARGGHKGIYNISGEDYMSVLEMVIRIARFFKLNEALIIPISSNTLNQKAHRPPISGFIIDKSKNAFGFHPHSLEKGLAMVQEQLGK